MSLEMNTALRALKGSHRPTLGAMPKTTCSTTKIQTSVRVNATTWLRSKAPSATPNQAVNVSPTNPYQTAMPVCDPICSDTPSTAAPIATIAPTTTNEMT